jgi:hypothetical protein
MSRSAPSSSNSNGKSALGWLAVLAAFASAGLWRWAANVKISTAEFGHYGGVPQEAIDLFAKQARLNSHAAIGISAVLQAIGLLLP